VVSRSTPRSGGRLTDAEWMKHNLTRAKMALPNGYCGLPLRKSCPHANACLTCRLFVTTAEFLPQQRKQLDDTRALIAHAETNGHTRLAEMNRTVETNLLAIVTTLEARPSRLPMHSCGRRNMLWERNLRCTMTTASTSSTRPAGAAPTPSNAPAELYVNSAKTAIGTPSPRSRRKPASPAPGSTPSPNFGTRSVD